MNPGPRAIEAVGRTRRRSRARLVAASGVVSLAIAAAAQAQPRAITLEEAVAMARRNAPAIVQAEGQKRTTAAAVRSAYGALLPSLSLSAGMTRQLPSDAEGRTRIENGQIVTVPAEPWSSSYGLGASVTLFDGGQNIFNVREAQSRAAAANANAVTQLYAVTLSAKQQYFNVLAARETQIAAGAQLAEAEQQRRVAVAKARARVATRSDSLRSEIQVRNAQLAVSQAAITVASAEAALTRAVGGPTPVTAAPDAALAPVALNVDEASLRSMVAASPALRQAEASLKAARIQSQSTWTAYVPSVSASYSTSGSGSGNQFGLGDDDFSYGGSLRFSASLPIFNQFQRESQNTQSRVAETNAVAALRDARLAADEEMIRAVGAYRSAGERIESQTATLAAAEEDLRVQKQRYAAGGSTLLDVLTSQTQINQARADLIRARYDQRVAKAQIEALVGREL